MSAAAFHQLLQTASVLMVAVLALGFIFESAAPGWKRDAAVGLVCGLFAALTVPFTVSGGVLVDGRPPLVLISGLIGGPLAAILAVPLPLAAGLFTDRSAAVAGSLAVLGASLVGAAIHAATIARRRTIARPAVAFAALASPLTLFAYAVPQLATGDGPPALATLAAWTGLATLVGGLLALDERIRGEMVRQARLSARFCKATGHTSPEVLDGQIAHYWNLHERYGTDYAYLLVSIDDAPALRDELGPRGWEKLRQTVGSAIRRAVRASDTCAAMDFDRFGVLLPHATLPLAIPVAERVRESVAREGVSVSMGVADAVATGGLADVRETAEAALYGALAASPKGAIGPPADSIRRDEARRSFPGATGGAPPDGSSPHARRTDRQDALDKTLPH
jgi:GGDEF domain-containing protein